MTLYFAGKIYTILSLWPPGDLERK